MADGICLVEDCGMLVRLRGLCRRHYRAGLASGAFHRPTEVERFLAKVNTDGPTMPHMDTPCHVWTAGTDHSGYGVIGIQRDGKQKNIKAHRFSWQLSTGSDAGIWYVLHKCDNPPCVNPGHLFLGTHADNQLDKIAKGRQSHINGERSNMSKLTEKQVVEIRSREWTGPEHCRDLGIEYGVHRNSIRKILKGVLTPQESDGSLQHTVQQTLW